MPVRCPKVWPSHQHATGPQFTAVVEQNRGVSQAYVTHTTVRRPENSDTWTSNWALSMPGLCPRNYFAPTARSRWAVDCLSQQQRQKSSERGLPSQFFPLAKLFVEMSRQMLERVCKRDGVGRNCLWKLLLNHTRSWFPRKAHQSLLSIVSNYFLWNLLFENVVT